MNRNIIRVLIATIVIALGIGLAMPADAQPAPPDMIVNAAPVYGGAFSNLNIVGESSRYAVMVEGNRRVVVYDTTSAGSATSQLEQMSQQNATLPKAEIDWLYNAALKGGRDGAIVDIKPNSTTPQRSYGGNPPRLATGVENIGRVWDIAAEAKPDGVIVVYAVTQKERYGQLLSKWSWTPGQDKLIKLGETVVANQYYVTIVDDWLIVTGKAGVQRLDKNLTNASYYLPFSTVGDPFRNAVYSKVAYWDGIIYIPFWYGQEVHLVDLKSMKALGVWDVGRSANGVAVDSQGKYLMVKTYSYNGPDGSDFLVFDRITRELKLTQWDGISIYWNDEPETSAIVEAGHLLIAGGWAALQIWDIESREQLMGRGHRPIGGIYPSEVVRKGRDVYVVDHYFGVRKTAYNFDDSRGSGGYYDTTPLIPALADATKAVEVGRFLAVLGGSGLMIYDPVADRITDYETFVSGDWRGTNLSITATEGVGFWTLTVGDESQLWTLTANANGKLERIVETSWFGDKFVRLEGTNLLLTITLGGVSKPTLVSVIDLDGTIHQVVSPGRNTEHGLDIAVDSTNDFVYVLTEDFGSQSQYFVHVYVLNPTLQWRHTFQVGRASSIAAGFGRVFVNEVNGVTAFESNGTRLDSYNLQHPYYVDHVVADDRLVLATSNVGATFLQMDGDELKELKTVGLEGRPYSATFSSDSRRVLLGLGDNGLQVIHVGRTVARLFMPYVATR